MPVKPSDDAERAVAAWLARRSIGYSVTPECKALGWRSHGGVRGALARGESGGDALKRPVSQLLAKLG